MIDPDTLEPVADGEDGELVITSLTKEALPIIRYRTGDITSLTREKCKCGRTTMRMARVKGRTDDMLIIRGVNVFPSEIERELLQIEGLAPHYQIHLLKKGNMDAIELHVELTSKLYEKVGGDLSHPLIQLLTKEIKHDLKNACLISVSLVIENSGAIPRSEGKAIRVIDRRMEQKEVLQ